MKLHYIPSFLIITLLLAACASGTSTNTPVVTENPTAPPTQPTLPTQPSVPTQPPASITYPAPGSSPTFTPSSAYPGPGGSIGTSGIPASGYEPQSGDDSLKRDKVEIDMTTSQVIVTASVPAQAKVVLTGTMPDPCHSLRIQVTPADANSIINIDAYSLVDTATGCVTKVETFTASVPLGSYESGQYTVNVNGEKLGTFQAVFAPQPDDDKLTRGDATVDMKVSKVVPSSTQPGSYNADLTGYMPDPCHQLRIVMTPADPEHNIKLEVYSVADTKNACITVIQPFRVIFPLGNFTSGHYSVYVNGELLGEFDI